MKRVTLTLAVLAIVAAAFGLWAAQSKAQTLATIDTPANVYAVKFLCGDLKPDLQGRLEGPVKPGDYQTAINIHNPQTTIVPFRKKAVLMFASHPEFQIGLEVPRAPGPRFDIKLEPDWGLEIDCADIRAVLLKHLGPMVQPPTFIKGWVVIEVPGRASLDIVTAYTAHGFKTDATGLQPEGFALEIERAYPSYVR